MMRRSLAPILHWFREKGWSPFPFQRETWQASMAGESGLLHAPTGTGKTLAVWMGPLAMAWHRRELASPGERIQKKRRTASRPLTALWITPLRALAEDSFASLQEPLEGLGLDWDIELRTGDTSASVKRRQRERLPTALVTTPESLALLLSYPESRVQFAHLRTVIVDEWHELLGTKRGVQVELCLARLRRWNPQLQTWGLSATIGNLEEAATVLLHRQPARVIHAKLRKRIVYRTLLPSQMERFPWSGHLGLVMLPEVLAAMEAASSALLFTNTRSQAELWFQAIREAKPEWEDRIALHHGSLDQDARRGAERLLQEGRARCVVATSSLDLGVDFAPVDLVLQVGSPKGVARMVQRAGRSGHQPGAISRLVCVPTHAFELLEFVAARKLVEEGRIESRRPVEKPLDLLAQHLVTVILAEPSSAADLLAEVRTAWAFRNLSDEEWNWTLDFITRGGPALQAYPRYARIRLEGKRYVLAAPELERQHRLSIGTIPSDASILVRYLSGQTLGTVEESFIARLKIRDRFLFAGKMLELVRVRDRTAFVRVAKQRDGVVPRWGGGRLPMSTQLAAAVREELDLYRKLGPRRPSGEEWRTLDPILDLQLRWSALPASSELLIERLTTREGHHAFLYPMEGRFVHEGLAALLAYRLSRNAPPNHAPYRQ